MGHSKSPPSAEAANYFACASNYVDSCDAITISSCMVPALAAFRAFLCFLGVVSRSRYLHFVSPLSTSAATTRVSSPQSPIAPTSHLDQMESYVQLSSVSFLTLVLLALPAFASKLCYYRNKEIVPGDTPCDPTSEESTCCGVTDTCLSNKLCYVANINALHRGVSFRIKTYAQSLTGLLRAVQILPGNLPNVQPTSVGKVPRLHSKLSTHRG